MDQSISDSVIKEPAGFDAWKTLEATMLDHGMSYPADMATVASSTPNVCRPNRRSWFDGPPNLKLAEEKPAQKEVASLPKTRRRSRRQSEEVETLLLSHFTNPPRIGFGKMKPNQVKSRTLLIKNPHDYEQSVIVEKVPEKKKFSVDHRQFTVGPNDTFALTIDWAPLEVCNVREMLLFQIDNSYRVQSYVFGSVEAPPAKKKLRKGGLLSKKVNKPFSVIQTSSLANISNSYSPEKNRELIKKMQPPSKPAERRRSPRLAINKRNADSENQKPRKKKSLEMRSVKGQENDENVVIEVSKPEPRAARRKMRRSNTYSNVSGVGLPIPIINGETVEGHTSILDVADEDKLDQPSKSGEQEEKRKSLTSAKNSFNTPSRPTDKLNNVANNDEILIQKESLLQTPAMAQSGSVELPSFLQTPCIDQKTPAGRRHEIQEDSLMKTPAVIPKYVEPPSFCEDSLVDKQKIKIQEDSLMKTPAVIPKYVEPPSFCDDSLFDKQKVTVQEDSLMKTPAAIPKYVEPPSFCDSSLVDKQKVKVQEDSLMLSPATGPARVELPSFLQSPCKGGGNKVEAPSFLSPNRFLENSLLEQQKQSEYKSIEPSPIIHEHRQASVVGISPNSFLQDLNASKARASKKGSQNQVPSPESVLNDSIPHDIMMSQLKSVRKSLHEQSFEIPVSSSAKAKRKPKRLSKPCAVSERRDTFLKKRSSLAEKTSEQSGLFLTDDAKKAKVLQEKGPATSSPRRTTFTVLKKKSVLTNRRRAGSSPGKLLSESNCHTTLDVHKLEEVMERTEDSEVFTEENMEEGKNGKPCQNVSSGTVTKSKPSVLSCHSGNGKQLFSEADINTSHQEATSNRETGVCTDKDTSNLDVANNSSEFRSVVEIPETHTEFLSKRASLTVTKSRPSDALMCATGRPSRGTRLFKQLEVNREDEKEGDSSAEEVIIKASVNTSTSCVLTRSNNSTFEKSANSSFPCTPIHQLPTSPNPDHSRRSTHIVSEPKVINVTQMDKRKLFSPLEDCPESDNSSDAAEASPCVDNQEALVADNMKDQCDAPSVQSNNQDSSPKDEKEEGNGLLFIPIKKPALKTVAAVARGTERTQSHTFLKRKVPAVERITTQPLKRTRTKEEPAPSRTQVVTRSSAQTRKPGPKQKSAERLDRIVLKPKLPQSKLILVKKSKSAIPKHPLPFAAKNMYYDERWMEKQERGFVNWLNFILTPAEEYQSSNVKVKVDAGKLSLDVAKGNIKLAPTNEVLSFRAYTARRRLNRLRKSACKLFQSEELIKVIQRLEVEVENRRLVVRKDKMMHADLGVKQKILDMLLSYNPLWLRIGLETIFGEVLPLQSNSDAIGLSRFVLTRLLNNPDTATEFSHPSVPHLYRDGYAEATAQFTLKKFLMLVYFLDQAKQARLIEHNPCLFCKDSEFKTSKSLLLLFSREYLAGEGDITRHLGYLGCKVFYTQTPLEEFDYAVSTLATDLRDGLRLTRVLEFLCKKPELSKTLRVPAISRLQKIHNVEVVFKTLTESNIRADKVEVRDVVDGHREKTLRLLWTMVLHYQVEMLLNEEQLKEEIKILKRSLNVHNQLQNLLTYEQDLKNRRESAEPDLHTQNSRLDLLLKWCRSVCAFYNIKIENFTVSFSDGRALCYLVHHYHPALLPRETIRQQTTVTHLEEMEKKAHNELDVSLNDSCSSPAVFPDVEDPVVFEKLMNNEKENFKNLFEKVRELGGVPLMLKWSDMSNTIPDEKVVVTYLLYLCMRLLDVRQESRAARVIQLAWRNYRLQKRKAEIKARYEDPRFLKAVSVMQSTFRMRKDRLRFDQVRNAAVVLQTIWRKRAGARQERKSFLQMKQAAIMIQSTWRMSTQRQMFQRKLESVAVIQAFMRMLQVRRDYQKKLNAVSKIQRWFRSCLEVKKHRNEYLKVKRAATLIQSTYRGFKQQQSYRRQLELIVCLQSLVRGMLVRNSHTESRKRHAAAETIQQRWRAALLGRSARQKFLNMRQSVIVLQRSFRAVCAMRTERCKYQELKKAAICIQSGYRGMKVRQLLKNHKAARTIQATFRMYTARRNYLSTKQTVTNLQSLFRMKLAKRKYEKLRNATCVLQRYFRANAMTNECRHNFLVKKGAAITIQAFYKGYLARKYVGQLKKSHVAARSIQQRWKATILANSVRQEFIQMKQSAILLQRSFRSVCAMRTERCRYQELKKAAICVQSGYRGMKARQLLKSHKAARTIQATYRMYTARRNYLSTKQTVTNLQSLVRMKLAKRKYEKLMNAACVLQKYFRANAMTNECRHNFLVKKGAAITIQAFYKGYLARKYLRQLKKCHVAARTIQQRWKATILANSVRQEFVQMKQSAILLQRSFRSVCAMRTERCRYQELKKAAICVQSGYRGMKARQLLKSHKAARTIQATYRMYTARRNYLSTKQTVTNLQSLVRMKLAKRKYEKLRNAACVLQKYFRANAMTNECRHNFLVKKGAAITIQAFYKGYLARKYLRQLKKCHVAARTIQQRWKATILANSVRQEFVQMKQSAILLQRSFRSVCAMRTERCKYQELKKAAICIQSSYRGMKARQLLKNHKAARTIQTTYRMYTARRDFLSTKQTVTNLQSLVRMKLAKKKYEKLRNAAFVVQKRFRANAMANQCRHKFLVKKGAAITIQAFYKGYLARKYLRQLKKNHVAARAIQQRWKATILANSVRQGFVQMKRSAIVLQRSFRSVCAMRTERCRYQELKKAAICIQSGYRGMKARQLLKNHKAARTIQTTYRMYTARRDFLSTKQTVTNLQSLVRMKLAKKKYEKLRNAAFVVQKRFRANSMANQCRRKFLVKKGAAITIQAFYKGYLARKYLRQLKKSHVAARAIQQRWKATILANSVRQGFVQMKRSAIVLQRSFRSVCAMRTERCRYQELKKAAICVQSGYRGMKARQLLKNHKAAGTIQTTYRMYTARRNYLSTKHTVINLQSLVRMKLAKIKYEKLRNAACVLQKRFRANAMANQCRHTFLVKKGAAITIQAVFKGYLVRKQKSQLKEATVLIQSYFRGYLQRSVYNRNKMSAIKIQAAFRGHLVRKEQRRRSLAAIVLQAHIRRYIEQLKFLELKGAVISMQWRYRASKLALKERETFLEKKRSVVLMQAAVRGWVCRRQYLKEKSCIIKLQARIRQSQARHMFLQMKTAAVKIQLAWRMYQQRCVYEQQMRAIVAVQSIARGMLARKDFNQLKKRHNAAKTIQQRWRALVLTRSVNKDFLKLRQSVIVLQRFFRAVCAMTTERCRYQELKKAAICIQSGYRGMKARHLLKNHKAARTIQTTYRMYTARRNYLSTKQTVINLQSLVRMKLAKRKFETLRNAACVLQKHFRAKLETDKCRRDFLMKKGAVITIQAMYKGYLVRKQHRQLNVAAVVLQSCFRGFLQRSVYRRLQASAIKIQAAFRGHLVHKEQRRQFFAAIIIQAHIRRYIEQLKFLELKGAVISMQWRYRASKLSLKERETFLEKKRSVVLMQATVRGWVCRRQYLKEKSCIIKLQARIRQSQARHKFLTMKTAAVRIQSAWRMYQQRCVYEHQVRAIVIVQSIARGMLARKLYLQLTRRHMAATVIQQRWRAAVLGRSARQDFLKIRQSVIVLQRSFKAVCAMRTEICRYQELKKAAICIQSGYRGMKARQLLKNHKAARTIQAAFRMYKGKTEYWLARQNIIDIQAVIRMWQERQKFLRVKQAVCVLQKYVRAKIEGDNCRYDFLEKKGAARTIQAVYRGHLVRRQQQQMMSAATVIQSCYRGYSKRKQFLRLKTATIIVQHRYLARKQSERDRSSFIEKRQSSIVIQNAIRRWICRRQYIGTKNIVKKLQSRVRQIQLQRRYLILKQSTTVIQRRWRSLLLTRKQQAKFRQLQEAVLVIQAAYRGRQARHRLHEIRAAIKIQSWMKMLRERKRFNNAIKQVTMIQSLVRRRIARQEFLDLQEQRRKTREEYLCRVTEVARRHLKVVIIQRAWRKQQMLKVYQTRLHSVCVIQSWMKAKLTRLHYLQDREKICKLQAAIRKWLSRRQAAAIVIQNSVRTWLTVRQEGNHIKSATRIQALWRGYSFRKQCRSKRMSRIRQRVQVATASATEEKTLGSRTSSALDYLLKYKQLAHILEALMHLDVATRLSSVCCERMVEVNAVGVLYRLVRCCNRSLPHMEIIKYTVNILLNLAKYEKTRTAVYEVEEGVSTLLELMQIYREKGQIFIKACTLFGILALCPQCKSSILSEKKMVEKLKSLQILTARKHKIDENHRITRAKMNATFTLMPRSPMKKHRIKPDWHLHKDKMTEIEDPLKAINFVIGSLGISSK